MSVWEERMGHEFMSICMDYIRQKQENKNIDVLVHWNDDVYKSGTLIQWNNDGSGLVQIKNHFGCYNASNIVINDGSIPKSNIVE